MQCTARVASPLGEILLAGGDTGLEGLWFADQRFAGAGLADDAREDPAHPVLRATRAWLERYFAGEDPGQAPPLAPHGTLYQRCVWDELLRIPYGATDTYGALARRLEARRGAPTSARAVGSAVARNPLSILIPCHRVIAANGALTGYAGGLWRKRALLDLERTGCPLA